MGRLRSRLLDVGLIAAITVGAGVLSGSQRWTGFNSPDSEFYASLALFGSDVADRALEPAYTTTRLGYIVPVRVLVTTLDPFVGFALWRLLLIALIVGALYATVRLVSTRQLAVIVSSLAALNTVVLSYVGTTYLTGTILAAVLVLLALGAWGALGTPSRPWLPALLSGAVAAWLLMLNPYSLLLGLAMWIGLRAVPLMADAAGRWQALGRDAAAATVGFAVVTVGFLAAGLVVFPGRNWLGTYLDWNARLDYSVFVGDPDVWQRDIALLVPLLAVAVAAIALVTSRLRRAAAAALVVAATNWAFTLGYLALVPGPWLESPTYVAKLWAGALAALALALGALVGRRSLGWPGWAVAAGAFPLVLWSGRWDRDLPPVQGLLVATAMLLLVVVAALLLRRAGDTLAWATAVVTVAAITGLALGSQVLQNGRGLLGIYGQFPFRAAFVDFEVEGLMRSKVAAQEFVLAQTGPGDRIGVWTDAERLTSGIAAMQLWGAYNTVGFSPTLTEDEATRLAESRPTAIAMYAPQREQVYAFWQSLPPQARASVPECTTVPFLGIGSPQAHVCVTRLDWTG
jgi:hypothetical protein